MRRTSGVTTSVDGPGEGVCQRDAAVSNGDTFLRNSLPSGCVSGSRWDEGASGVRGREMVSESTAMSAESSEVNSGVCKAARPCHVQR